MDLFDFFYFFGLEREFFLQLAIKINYMSWSAFMKDGYLPSKRYKHNDSFLADKCLADWLLKLAHSIKPDILKHDLLLIQLFI